VHAADQQTFMIISRSVILRIRNILTANCSDNQNTHFMSNKGFFENCAFCEITWKEDFRTGQATRDSTAHTALHAGWLREQTHIQNV
jgi:hypothetical protein